MAQHDYVIANQDGASFRADINDVLAAIVSNNSGAVEPSPTYAHMLWVDTNTSLVKQRNAANSAWNTIATLGVRLLSAADYVQSATASGYVKLPSGLILQWGSVSAATQITFPLAFPTACLFCIVNPNSSDTTSSNISANQFYISATTTTGATRGSTTFAAKYIAIGY